MRFQSKTPSKKKRQRRSRLVRIHIQNGRFQIVGIGAWYTYWRDPYHLLLTIPWRGFLAAIVLFYLTANALFALAYLAGGDCIANAHPGSFADSFFFSVQTLASIGYGAMYPKTTYANILVTIEAMVGLLGIALLTGLAFARFSKPTARVLFSRVATIVPHDGVPTLIFRTANQRHNQILEAQIGVYLMRDEVTSDGQSIRRIRDLKLLRHHSPNFMLPWSVMHPIDESSPLYGMTAALLRQMNTTLIVSLSGIDETVAQVVHARHMYAADEILWNNRFVDIFHATPDGHRHIDYTYFHDVVPLEQSD